MFTVIKKMIKNGFYFTLEAIFVLKICKFLSGLFYHFENQLDENHKVNFKLYHATVSETNNCNTQYLKK